MARNQVAGTVQVIGLKQLDRDLKQLHPKVQRELKDDLKMVAGKIAGEATARVGARSFAYRATATGTRASVVSFGPKGFVARFREFGFHPRGSRTLVQGRNTVGEIIDRREQQIIDGIDSAVDKAARSTGWH